MSDTTSQRNSSSWTYPPSTTKYHIEKSRKENFSDIHIRKNMLWHHIPSHYDKGLRKTLDGITGASSTSSVPI